MSEEYSRAALQICMAQICQHLGWNSIHSTPLELLTDVLERYLLHVAKTTHRYAEQFGRTEPRLEDVFIAFEHMGIQVSELDDYMKHVEPLPFAKKVVSYPVPCENDLKFPHPDSKEVQQRKVFDFVPEHLPYMHPELTEEEEEDVGEVSVPGSPERLKPVEPGPSAELSLSPAPPGAGPGEKRPAPSPGDSPLPFKRPRLTTSQPLPEEACASQYEMKSVVMTTSGILSPLVEGRGPDIKRPPVGIKQNVIIVRQKTTSSVAAPAGGLPGVRAPGESSIIRLDFNSDPTKKGKIVEVDEHIDVGVPEFDRCDPEYRPAKKKFQLQKRQEKEKKIKRGPGRPKSPGRAGAHNVIHNKGALGFKIPKIGDKKTPLVVLNSDSPIDLSVKATPPAPNINVVKVIDLKPGESIAPIEYKQKTISKEQEDDIEDTIDSVICKSKEMAEKESIVESPFREFEAKTEPAAEEWAVTNISETYSGPEDDDDESDHKEDDLPNTAGPDQPLPPPQNLAPHLRILQQFNHPSSQKTHMPRPRGRPKGSVSGFYKTQGTRGMMGSSPLGRKPGRPPGVGRSPTGRSPGRPPLSTRSPGRPPLSRSPGRPPFHRSPGRPPASGRSPGRPKGSTSGLSPKPRGRPRGSKSPRSRGASPRGGSPRSSISFDSHEPMDATDTTESRIPLFKNDNEAEDSGATLFSFPSRSRSPSREETHKKEPVPSIPDTPRSPSASLDEKSSSRMSSSPAPTEPALSRENTPELSDHEEKPEPVMQKSPSPKEKMIIKMEPSSPQKVREVSPKKHDFESRESYTSSEKDTKHKREKDRSQSSEKLRKEKDRSQSSEKLRKEKDSSQSSEKERKEHRHQKEHSQSKERERSKEKKKDKKKKKKKNKDRDRDRDRPREKERDKDEKHKEHREHKSKERADKEPVKESSPVIPAIAPLQKLKIKIGGGSASSPSLFSISQLEPVVAISPKHEPRSPPPPSRAPEMTVPKLKFKVLPPKPDGVQTGVGGEPAWTSSIKEEKRESTPKPESLFPSFKSKSSPKPRTESPVSRPVTSDSDNDLDDVRSSKAGDDGEVTMSVVKGKIMVVKKPDKKSKKKGSSKKGKSKSDVSNLRKELAEEKLFGGEKLSIFKENSPISPQFSPKNVPSPITIPALKAAPPPPSPPTSVKKSPPKPKAGKETRAPSPSALYKELMKSAIPPKTSKKSSSSGSPKKKSAVSPSSKKKDSTSPGKTSPTPGPTRILDFQAPKTLSPRRRSSSPVSSPMYSPASSPGRDSPLHFQIPPTPAMPTRYHSPQPSPPSRQISTDEEVETPPADRPKMPPPSLPPMPPSSAQKRGAQRTVILETVGSFVNESGEKVWICPSCTMQDDGSPMIGCDVCDDWYHWACVGIKTEPEEEESWYCSKCSKPNNKGKAGKRGRKKRRS